jgi:hypothetical protein
MLLTQPKPIEEVLGMLKADGSVFLLGCGGCPVGADTGGEAKLAEIGEALTAAGKKVTGSMVVDFLCNKALVGSRFYAPARVEQIKAADRVLVVSCGVGVQASAAILGKPVAPALNTISVNGNQGLWPSTERCNLCGDCLLGYTGGICPINTCSKSLVNGTCGGTDNGKCEVSAEKDCGWFLIYNRLKSLGRIDDLRRMNPNRDFSKSDIPDSMRKGIYWALEYAEQEEEVKT